MPFSKTHQFVFLFTYLFTDLIFNLYASENFNYNQVADSVSMSANQKKSNAVFQGIIKSYQEIISSQYYSGCVFETSCSHFAVESFKQRNSLEALLLTADRIQRCHALASLHYNNKYEYEKKVYDPIRSYLFDIKKEYVPDKYQISDRIIENTNTPFADYLLSSGDYLRALSEYEKFKMPGQNAFLNLKIGICYKKASQLDVAGNYFFNIISRSPDSEAAARAALQLGHTLYLKNEYANSLKVLNKMPELTDLQLLNEKSIVASLNFLHNKEWENCKLFLEEKKNNFLSARTYGYLTSICERGQRITYKSAALSGLLSAAIPGAGKMYCGKTMDGLNSLFIVGLGSFFSYNYYKSQGIKPFTVICALTTLTLYAGNIYGSYLSAKYYQRIEEDKLVNEMQIIVHLHLLR
jgi:putative membrane protein insertion efficiency factor